MSALLFIPGLIIWGLLIYFMGVWVIPVVLLTGGVIVAVGMGHS